MLGFLRTKQPHHFNSTYFPNFHIHAALVNLKMTSAHMYIKLPMFVASNRIANGLSLGHISRKQSYKKFHKNKLNIFGMLCFYRRQATYQLFTACLMCTTLAGPTQLKNKTSTRPMILALKTTEIPTTTNATTSNVSCKFYQFHIITSNVECFVNGTL